MKMMHLTMAVMSVAVFGLGLSGCTTTTRRYVANETRRTIAGFSEEDITDTVSRAVQNICALDRVKLLPGSNRAIMVVEDVTNDTTSRGIDAGALAEALGQSLREELTNSGKVIVYNKEVGQYATVKVTPQYVLRGRLTQRSPRQDNGDMQVEYNLNLTMIDLQTGLEFWQKRVHVGKLVDANRLM